MTPLTIIYQSVLEPCDEEFTSQVSGFVCGSTLIVQSFSSGQIVQLFLLDREDGKL